MGQKVSTPPSRDHEDDILTPKAPSIAFPLANPPVAPEPQVRILLYLKHHTLCARHLVASFTVKPLKDFLSLSRSQRKNSSHPDSSSPLSPLRNALITVTS